MGNHNNIIPNVPSIGTGFGGEVEHLDHHRKLEAAVEAIVMEDVNTLKPTLSITTTTAGALIIALGAAGILTTSA